MNTENIRPYEIDLAVDHQDAQEFADWINMETRHSATVGTTTGTVVTTPWGDLMDTYARDALLRTLWDRYCREACGEEPAVAVETKHHEGRYLVKVRESGDVLFDTNDLAEAEHMVAGFEESDKREGIFESRYYAIVDTEE